MKKITLFFAIIFLRGHSQNEKGLFSFSTGQAMPVGIFANSHADQTGAGFAKTGLMYKISASYLLSEKFGVVVRYMNQQNPVNVRSLADQINSSYSEPNWNVTSKSWNSTSYMIGMTCNLPLIKNKDKIPLLFLDINGLIGTAIVSLPQQTISSIQNSTLTGSRDKQIDADPTFAISTKIRYKVFKALFAHISADYLRTAAQFKNSTMTFSDGSSQMTDLSQKVRILSFGAGLDIMIR